MTKVFEPSYPKLPAVDKDGRSSVPGIYVVGEAAGIPLLKLGINEGARVAERIAHEMAERQGRVVVIGAGAAGLACALRLKRRGVEVVVVEQQALAQTVVGMTQGKKIFAEPLNVANTSDLWLEETTREELLEKWRAAVRDAGLDVRERERVIDVKRVIDAKNSADSFDVFTSAGTIRAARVVVAVGKAGNPRKAGVPGESEHAGKIFHALADADAIRGQRILIYGGGDVACEAALALAPHNTVTMVTIDPALTFPKKRNKDAIEDAARAGKVSLYLGTKLLRIEKDIVVVSGAAGERQIENDLVFEMIGADPPLAFFQKIGLAIEGAWTVKRVFVAALVFAFVYSLYALKKFPEQPFAWPFTALLDADAFTRAVNAVFEVAFLPFRPFFDPAAYADIQSTLWFQQGYLYSLAYTILMICFGRIALVRWTSIAKRPSYQRWRYTTLIAFQIVFFLAANVVAVQALSIQHSWRAWGLYQPWPLFFHTFHWWSESDPDVVKWGFIGTGLIGTFVVIPLLSWKHGKRFCTWVCGCGGLAETLGDRWRHLSPKGRASRRWEVQGLVILVVAAIVTLITVGAYQTRADNAWALAYSYIVDFWLVSVLPIAAYPFFGGKLWCRYWCPLAAWNQILARLYGRLGIASNDKCISCGQCSKQCQVGVDVMQFAKRQERFDNRNSGCIHCGICIDICPVDVLSFTTTKRNSLPIV